MRYLVMLLVVALIAGCGEKQGGAGGASTKAPSLQLRLLAEQPSTSSEAVTFTNGQQVLYAQQAVLLDETSGSATWIWQRGHVVGMDLTLTGAGKARLGNLTRHNIGKRMAIVIDGRLRSAPKIENEWSSTLTVVSDWSFKEANEVAREFDAVGTERSRGR